MLKKYLSLFAGLLLTKTTTKKTWTTCLLLEIKNKIKTKWNKIQKTLTYFISAGCQKKHF